MNNKRNCIGFCKLNNSITFCRPFMLQNTEHYKSYYISTVSRYANISPFANLKRHKLRKTRHNINKIT